MKRLNWFEKLFIAVSYLFMVQFFFGPSLATAANTNAAPVPQQTLIEKVGGTNLNDVVVDILRGAKSAGGEIYQASKQAITKAVDFTMEQAPLVVKEFLRWQVAQSIMWILIWGSVAACLLILSRHFRIRAEKSEYYEDDYIIGKWLARICGLALLILTLGINGMTIVKVCVAPRVFLIEYVVDSIHNHVNGQ